MNGLRTSTWAWLLLAFACGGSSTEVAEAGSAGSSGASAGSAGEAGPADESGAGGSNQAAGSGFTVDDDGPDPVAGFAEVPVEDLPDDQREILCDDLRQTARETVPDERLRRVTCVTQVLPASMSPQACEQSAQQCVEEAESSGAELPEASLDGVACDDIAPPDCPLTAAEVQTCSEDFAAQIDELIDLLSCDRAGNAGLLLEALQQSTQLRNEIPDTCVAVEEQCGLALSSALRAASSMGN